MQRTVRGNPGVRAYDPLSGVPKRWYYLSEVIEFDAWGGQTEAIRYVAPTKAALVELCRKKRWKLDEEWAEWNVQRNVPPRVKKLTKKEWAYLKEQRRLDQEGAAAPEWVAELDLREGGSNASW